MRVCGKFQRLAKQSHARCTSARSNVAHAFYISKCWRRKMFEGSIFLQKQQQQPPQCNIRNSTSHIGDCLYAHNTNILLRIHFSCNKSVQQALLSNALCCKQQQCPLESTHRYIVIHTYLFLSNLPPPPTPRFLVAAYIFTPTVARQVHFCSFTLRLLCALCWRCYVSVQLITNSMSPNECKCWLLRATSDSSC